jgi:hypothetical protein
MTARDPRIDPQPGDEVRGIDDKVRRVIWREGKMLMCESENMRYQMRVRLWQLRCRQAEAPSAAVPKKTAAKKKRQAKFSPMGGGLNHYANDET